MFGRSRHQARSPRLTFVLWQPTVRVDHWSWFRYGRSPGQIDQATKGQYCGPDADQPRDVAAELEVVTLHARIFCCDRVPPWKYNVFRAVSARCNGSVTGRERVRTFPNESLTARLPVCERSHLPTQLGVQLNYPHPAAAVDLTKRGRRKFRVRAVVVDVVRRIKHVRSNLQRHAFSYAKILRK